MRTVIKQVLEWRALALLVGAVIVAPVTVGALTPDDASRAFEAFMHRTDVSVPSADSNCDGDVTPADARSLYRRYLLDLPARDCARDTAGALPPPTVHVRHQTTPATPGHATRHVVSIEVAAPGTIAAFGLQLSYPPEQFRLVEVRPGADLDHWVAADATEPKRGVIVAGGFDVDAATRAEPLQLVHATFEARGPVNWRDIVVRETLDDIAGARVRHSGNSVSPATPDRLRLQQAKSNHAVPAISYDVPGCTGGSVRTRLTVYDATGVVARILVDGVQAPGSYAALWDGTMRDGSRATPGTYYARLQVRVGTREMEESMRVVIQ